MKFIIIHRDSPQIGAPNKNQATDNGNLLQFAISSQPIAGLIFEGLNRVFLPSRVWNSGWKDSKVVYAVPKKWSIELLPTASEIITYEESVPIYSDHLRRIKQNVWAIFMNGRFSTQVKTEPLKKILSCTDADVLSVNAEPELLAYREKVRLTAENKVAGFHRLYADSAEPAPTLTDWPHYTFIKTGVLDRILIKDTLPESFTAFLQGCRSAELTMQAINVAGVACDLETEAGLLNFCRNQLSKIRYARTEGTGNSNIISADSRIVGKVLLGKDVQIGPKAIVIGPTIICDNVRIKKGAVVNSSIIGPGTIIPQNQLVQNRVVTRGSSLVARGSIHDTRFSIPNSRFMSWPRFSYARYFKRIADCLAAIIVLILFAPIMPFIALAIKLTSPGPVFFKDKRQGLHGKEFNCLKFRSMTIGAGTIQEHLRKVSQVDGPQFKMIDDPRLTSVGRFLRDTFIDEIPQFFNVLSGQMSVVGPRPSPESENTLCPFWRDARLSVRPGITGLWQICRTRNPMKDFQEWIHYDTEYVRNLRLRMDLWISWQTAKKLFDNFINQF